MLAWATETQLNNITEGYKSELFVKAEQQTFESSQLTYSLVGGNLPAGLSFRHDGIIAGKVNYQTSGNYTFQIKVKDILNSEESTKSFSLTVEESAKKYTEVYFQPYLTKEKRELFRNFILNEDIFRPSLMYRYWDTNFGVQSKLKMVLEFGLEQLNINEYIVALRENFYRKTLFLGKPKVAIAKDQTGQIIYEVVYVDVIDELVNSNNVSVSPVVYSGNEIYYPASIENMQKQLRLLVLQNRTFIDTNDDLQPKFMKTQQGNIFRPNTYMRVVPLCYTLPKKSSVVMDKIKNSGFKFNQIHFEIDRVLFENTLESSTKYFIFDRQSLGNQIPEDDQLFGPEGWVRLDDENDVPITRE